MPKEKKIKGKGSPGPCCGQEAGSQEGENPLYKTKPKNLGIRQDIQPKRDITCFVKCPHYIRLQQQRALLYKQLKVPPMINQFAQSLDCQTATQLLKLAHKYRPETTEEAALLTRVEN
ncbi:60S ribosomal protein L7a [Sciurus carolinensis]|uniref:60S ribosomal protein L7a n=1 Tax=Sciurus carolinensis TaxID=30640 RepID=A0AA41MZW7_SCICA|nr:60S ribosomal protein L7a [Sciurus carolinensis]